MGLYDLVQLETTVTAQSGATVTLASVEGLEVGDRIIIESDHGYDEEGLDGDWTITNLGDFAGSGNYYLDVTHIGKSFIGTIQAGGISGNVVTVDRTVPAGAVGLNCYRENGAAVKYAIENKLSWPRRKRFAVASSNTAPIRCYMTDDYHEFNFNHCTLFAPRGCGPLGLSIAKIGGGPVDNKFRRNLVIESNQGDAGYGFFAETGVYIQGASMGASLALAGTGGAAPSGPAINSRDDNITFKNTWRPHAISIANDCFATNCRSTNENQLRTYVQWDFNIVSSRRSAYINCYVDGDYSRPSFEPFKSIGCSFINCHVRNGFFASNSSGGCTFMSCGIIIDEEYPHSSQSPDLFLMNINRIIETQQGSPAVGTDGGIGVFDFSIRYDAIPYPDDGANGEIWKQIGITPGNQGINVGAKIYGVDFKVVRTNVTYNNGLNDGYVVNNNAAATDTIVSGVTGDTLDTGTKLLGVTETVEV